MAKEISEKVEGSSGEILPLKVGGKDVYNPTPPFELAGKTIIAARVEDRDKESGSEVRFFELTQNAEWKLMEEEPRFLMQDPFVCRIGGNLVLGGVEVDWEKMGYKTVFYSGVDLFHLRYLTSGPAKMKDIRLVQLRDGMIGVFTRPQGEIGGRGKIGFTTINNLKELNSEVIANAKLIENQFGEEQWGGVNQALLLPDGRVGVLGHVAEFTKEENRCYKAMAFIFDPVTGKSTPMKIVAERNDFPATTAKRDDLWDIVFPAGLVLEEGGAVLYAGLSDTGIGRVKIRNPFIG